MPVITLSRQMGSLGDEIAMAVAQRLGLRLAGRELINRAARAAGAPEIALAEIDELGLLGVKPSAAALRLYRASVAEIIEELAAGGQILLVGRGSQSVLAKHPGVLRVRIIAPRAQRIATIQKRCQVPTEVATSRVDASDRARASYLRRHHRVRLSDPALYDLVINMERLDVETATALICDAAIRMGQTPCSGTARPAAEGSAA